MRPVRKPRVLAAAVAAAADAAAVDMAAADASLGASVVEIAIAAAGTATNSQQNSGASKTL